MVFGESKQADILLAVLDLTRGDLYRYRDCYLTDDGRIAVYTRGGGNNRDCYCWQYADHELAPGEHLDGCAVVAQRKMEMHPLYLYSEDDDCDSTYATFYYRVPDDAAEKVAGMVPEQDRDERWQEFIAALKSANDKQGGMENE